MNELALFAGAGGGILGGKLLGWKTVCAVELNAYCARRLMQRQNEGHLPPFPIWDDVRTFDGRPWRGIVDVVSGGFPCQDISVAGSRAGIDGSRSGLWMEMARIIREVRPRFAFVENSPMLTSLGLHRVLADLSEMGFDARWGVISAENTGALHIRERLWIVANTNSNRGRLQPIGQPECSDQIFSGVHGEERDDPDTDSKRKLQSKRGLPHERGRTSDMGEDLSDSCQHGLQARYEAGDSRQENAGEQPRREPVRVPPAGRPKQWPVEPDVGRVAHGVASRVDRIKSIGNGQVPRVVELAWTLLKS